MKIVLLSIVFALTSHIIFAQENYEDSKIQLLLTTQLGAFDLPSTFYTRQLPICIEGCIQTGSEPSTSYGIGFEARIKIFTNVSLSSGISYFQNSYREKFTFSAGGPNINNYEKYSFDFLDIPVKAHLDLIDIKNRPITVFTQFGVVNHINLTTDFPDSESEINLEKYGVSTLVSLGLRFNLKSISMEIAPFYTSALKSMGTDVHPYEDFYDEFGELGPPFYYTPSEFKPSNFGINFNFVLGL